MVLLHLGESHLLGCCTFRMPTPMVVAPGRITLVMLLIKVKILSNLANSEALWPTCYFRASLFATAATAATAQKFS